MENLAFTGTVLTAPSKTFNKTNGGEYNLQSVLITEGPLKGKNVTGTRTIKNANGDTNDSVNKGDEVMVYPRQSDTGKWFFELSTQVAIASDEDISALLGVQEPVEAVN